MLDELISGNAFRHALLGNAESMPAVKKIKMRLKPPKKIFVPYS